MSTPDQIPRAVGSVSKAKGMQLGASKTPASTHMPAEWAEEAAAEAEAEEALQGNPWGTDDLMDVNADQDDWSKCSVGLALAPCSNAVFTSAAFETAPAPVVSFGFSDTGHDAASNDWGAELVAPATRKPGIHSQMQSPVTTSFRSSTPSESGKTDPVHSRGASPAPAAAAMSKEEKAAEMARRKEERKQVRLDL